jgi:hypothetical protein
VFVRLYSDEIRLLFHRLMTQMSKELFEKEVKDILSDFLALIAEKKCKLPFSCAY